MKVERVVPFFKIIEFFENRDGDHDVMFIEMVDAAAVVQDYIGIEDENFLGGCHAFGVPFPLHTASIRGNRRKFGKTRPSSQCTNSAVFKLKAQHVV